MDPISKRRFENLGEVDQYLMKDHHETIISEEMREQAQAILKRRTATHTNENMDPNIYREQYSRILCFQLHSEMRILRGKPHKAVLAQRIQI